MARAGSRTSPARSGGAGRQAAWNYLIFALSKVSTLIMTMILARLLVPADFGLFALGLLVLNLFDYLRDLGVAAALVQRKEDWGRLAPTGLTLAAIFGVLMAAAAVGLAPVIARALSNERLTEITQVLAVGLLIASAATLPQALLRRRLDFRGRLVPELAGALVKVAVAIGFALGGAGVWSLVWGQLAAAAVTTALYWGVAPATPRFGFEQEAAGDLLRFGLPVTTVSLLTFVEFNVPTAAIGRNLGDEALGLYTLTYRLPDLLVLNLCVIIGEVLFSALSRHQHDLRALASRYLSAVAAVMALTAPLGLGIAAVAGDLIVVLFGPRYAAAADVLAVLALYTVVYSASFHSGDVYKAIGRPMILTYLTIGGLSILIPSVWLASGRSALAVAVTLLCLEMVHFVVRIGIVTRVLDLRISDQARSYRGPVSAAVLMGVVVWGTGFLLPTWPPVVRLALLVPLGAAVYVGALRWWAPSTMTALLDAIGRRAQTS